MRQPSTSAGAPVSFACDASTSSSTRAAGDAVAGEVGAPARRPCRRRAAACRRRCRPPRSATAASGAARARGTRPRRARRARRAVDRLGDGTRGSTGAPRGTRGHVRRTMLTGRGPRAAGGRARGRSPRANHAGSRPRTIATGTPAALPITSSAADAISSAIATSVTCSSRPSASVGAAQVDDRGDPGSRRWRRR